MSLIEFQEAFVAAALWSSTYEHDDCNACKEGQCNPACDDGEHEICQETQEFLDAVALTFWKQYGYMCSEDNLTKPLQHSAVSQAGHDFWLTSQGHGCGFWDGDWKEYAGECLTNASKGILNEGQHFFVNQNNELEL